MSSRDSQSGDYRTVIKQGLDLTREGNKLLSNGKIVDGLLRLRKAVEIAIFNPHEEGNWLLKIRTIVPFVVALLTHPTHIKYAKFIHYLIYEHKKARLAMSKSVGTPSIIAELNELIFTVRIGQYERKYESAMRRLQIMKKFIDYNREFLSTVPSRPFFIQMVAGLDIEKFCPSIDHQEFFLDWTLMFFQKESERIRVLHAVKK